MSSISGSQSQSMLSSSIIPSSTNAQLTAEEIDSVVEESLLEDNAISLFLEYYPLEDHVVISRFSEDHVVISTSPDDADSDTDTENEAQPKLTITVTLPSESRPYEAQPPGPKPYDPKYLSPVFKPREETTAKVQPKKPKIYDIVLTSSSASQSSSSS